MDTALRYFYEAAAMGSMRLASERIGVAVSSISRQIAQLELQLGMPLIERGQRSIKLTEAGRVAFQHYQNQHSERELFLARLQDLRGMKAGNIDLAVGEGFLSRAFTAMIGEFQEKNSGVSVSVTVASSVEIVRMILEDEAHIGLVFQVPSEPKIRLRTSIVQPLMVVASPSHPIAKLPTVTLQELAKHELCLPPKGFRIREALAVAEAHQHIWLQPAMTTNSIFAMRETAISGKYVTVLPRIGIWSELEDGQLVASALADAHLEKTTVNVICRLGRQLPLAPSRLLSVLETRLRSWAHTP